MMEPFNSLRAPGFAKNGLACSSQPLVAALGGEILRAGGNAADAAVAMVNITEPMMNGLGSDCMVLVHWNGEFFGLDAGGRATIVTSRFHMVWTTCARFRGAWLTLCGLADRAWKGAILT